MILVFQLFRAKKLVFKFRLHWRLLFSLQWWLEWHLLHLRLCRCLASSFNHAWSSVLQVCVFVCKESIVTHKSSSCSYRFYSLRSIASFSIHQLFAADECRSQLTQNAKAFCHQHQQLGCFEFFRLATFFLNWCRGFYELKRRDELSLSPQFVPVFGNRVEPPPSPLLLPMSHCRMTRSRRRVPF